MRSGWMVFLGASLMCLMVFAQAAFPAPKEVTELSPHAIVMRETNLLTSNSQAGPGFTLLAIMDVNHDGHPDLISSYDNQVVVMVGDGKGGFTPGPWSYYELKRYQQGMERPGRSVDRKWTLYDPQEVDGIKYVPAGDIFFPQAVIVDMNRDTLPDIAVAANFIPDNNGESVYKLYIFRNEGKGQFVPVYQSDLKFAPDGIWTGDLNGDGQDDLIFSDQRQLFFPVNDNYFSRFPIVAQTSLKG